MTPDHYYEHDQDTYELICFLGARMKGSDGKPFLTVRRLQTWFHVFAEREDLRLKTEIRPSTGSIQRLLGVASDGRRTQPTFHEARAIFEYLNVKDPELDTTPFRRIIERIEGRETLPAADPIEPSAVAALELIETLSSIAREFDNPQDPRSLSVHLDEIIHRLRGLRAGLDELDTETAAVLKEVQSCA